MTAHPPKTVDAAEMLALADKIEKADTYQLRTGFTDSERELIGNSLRLAATAAKPAGDWNAAIEFPYTQTFQAIAAAVEWKEHRQFGISVQKFQEAFNAAAALTRSTPSPQPEAGAGVNEAEALRAYEVGFNITHGNGGGRDEAHQDGVRAILAHIAQAGQSEAGAGVTEEQLETACKAHRFYSLRNAGLSADELDYLTPDNVWEDIEEEETRQHLREAMRRAIATLSQAGQSEAGWRPIESAPKTSDDILVGAWMTHDGQELAEGQAPEKWCQVISSYEDQPWRRGFRHRAGADWATHWQPLPVAPNHPGVDRG